MEKAGVLLTTRDRLADTLFYSWSGSNRRARSVFLFSAWMMSIQYCDYPFDNHKVSFPDMRNALRRNKVDNLQFGALTSLFTMIPILNLVIMPVAVCGATAMWVDRYRAEYSRIQP